MIYFKICVECEKRLYGRNSTSERKNWIIIEKYVECKNLNCIEKFIKFHQSNTFVPENLMKPKESVPRLIFKPLPPSFL